jgi:hypothetical protein
MANTFEKIASVTVTTSGSQIQFSSIPQTYTDLCLKISAQTAYTLGGADAYLRFQTNANYYWKKLQNEGSGGSAYGANNTDNTSPWALNGTFTANTFSNTEVYIPNYTNTSKFKSFIADSIAENNAVATYGVLAADSWHDTSAITSILLSVAAGFIPNSNATLYGIKNS